MTMDIDKFRQLLLTTWEFDTRSSVDSLTYANKLMNRQASIMLKWLVFLIMKSKESVLLG